MLFVYEQGASEDSGGPVLYALFSWYKLVIWLHNFEDVAFLSGNCLTVALTGRAFT